MAFLSLGFVCKKLYLDCVLNALEEFLLNSVLFCDFGGTLSNSSSCFWRPGFGSG